MITKREKRYHRKLRIRAKVNGTAIRPRLTIFKSNKYISAQIINDEKGETVSFVRISGTTVAKGKELGMKIIESAKKKGIKNLVFDRSGYRYHGVVKTIAETVREGGLTV